MDSASHLKKHDNFNKDLLTTKKLITFNEHKVVQHKTCFHSCELHFPSELLF